jgi:hypothetical protein
MHWALTLRATKRPEKKVKAPLRNLELCAALQTHSMVPCAV